MDGSNRRTFQTNRTPLFLIGLGLYPDIEPISSGTNLYYNYLADLQIGLTSFFLFFEWNFTYVQHFIQCTHL